MSSHHTMSVTPPGIAPVLIVLATGIPAFVVLALAVIFNWGR